MTATTLPADRKWSLSEDWLATIIGLAIVLLIGSGILGPGPQTVTMKARTGETKETALKSLDGWQVSATLGGEKASIADAVTNLENGKLYAVVCENGSLTTQAAEAIPTDAEPLPAGHALLVVTNNCDGEVSLTYKTNPAIPWPIFNLFAR